MIKKLICCVLLVFEFISAFSIDYTWWNEVHHWDGKTSWPQYLKYSSKYMGSNALPVPESVKGLAGSSSFFELNSASHFYVGDKTSDIGYNGAFNLVKNYVTLQVFGTLVEHYQMDTATRNIRGCRNFLGKGFAMGDVNISTIIQLTRDTNLPNVALRVNLRTASGGMMEDARYTDGPGYYFDLSAGKNFMIKSQIIDKIKMYADAGFYCWQTELVEKRQSDAIMYSVGFDLFSKKTWQLSNEISGYNGHLGDGDSPLICRTSLHFNKNNYQFYIQYFYGIRDYVYRSVRLGYIFYFQINSTKEIQ